MNRRDLFRKTISLLISAGLVLTELSLDKILRISGMHKIDIRGSTYSEILEKKGDALEALDQI